MSCEVLFLDLARVSGYAAGGLRGVEGFGRFELPSTQERIGPYLNLADKRIEALVRRFDPALLAFEAPWLNARRDTIINLRKLSGLANVAEQVADRFEIPCQEAEVRDIAKHFLGAKYHKASGAKKISTKVKCRELGWDVDDDNEADALAGLSFVLACKHPLKALETVPMAKFLVPAA